jgi:hypothetical protein
MAFGDIFIAYVQWNGGGKVRPILVVKTEKDSVYAYRITTRYENKSPAVQSNYYEIAEWQSAGLDKPSYIDTSDIIRVSARSVSKKPPIGELSLLDSLGLIRFLESKNA